MRIVIDTNIVISAIFFGGVPRKIIEAVVNKMIDACATPEITVEYQEIIQEMISRKQGHLRMDLFNLYLEKLRILESKTRIHVCLDPDDDKFLSCAIDAKAIYIVSGDKDLLDIRDYNGVEIITAAEFCERFGL